MTRKDYIELARLLRANVTEETDVDGIPFIYLSVLFIEDLSDYLKFDNPNFDKGKFLKAIYD